MKKLTKAHLATRDQIQVDLDAARALLEAALTAYNDVVRVAYAELQDATNTFNEAMENLEERTREMADPIREYADARSEKWNETNGDAYDGWASSWEDWDAGRFEPDEPEEIGMPDEPEALDTLPAELP